MTRLSGRNIYITSLQHVLASAGGPAGVAARSRDARLSAIWVRLARGTALDSNFTLPNLTQLQAELDKVGVGLWGWHVPFCKDQAAAKKEAQNVAAWAEQFSLAGVLIDAERTPESPRFQGGTAEAKTYCETLRTALAAKGRGIALSSHDQPSLHTDLPFGVFLQNVEDNCPQVYYRSTAVQTRFDKSVHDYKPLEAARDFVDRYKPTGNITTSGDIPMPNVPDCLAAAKTFMDLVHAGGYRGYSFWCWDTAPNEIWPFFKQTPV